MLTDLRPDDSTIILECPNAHFISVIKAGGKCGDVEYNIRGRVWELCSRKNICQLDNSILEKCNKDIVIHPITFTCSKVHAMECFLFHSKNVDNGFCFHMCMNFMKNCQSERIHVTREERLKCLHNLFNGHLLYNKCTYVLESVDHENMQFDKKEYFDLKYETGKVTVENKKWTQVHFKNRIENPIIITSILPETEDYMAVLIDHVTTAGFLISINVVSCFEKCQVIAKNKELTIRWLAITTGDHSPELNKAIKVGSLETRADQEVVLPLDTQRNWIVITQIQKIDVTSDYSRRKNEHVLTIPVAFKSISEYIVRFFVPAVEYAPTTNVILGYVAFEDKEDITLYGIGLKTFIITAPNILKASVRVKLPYTWPYPSHLFGLPIKFLDQATEPIRSYVTTLTVPSQQNKEPVIKVGKYNFEVDLGINYVELQPFLISGPVVNGIIIEEVSSSLRRQICSFATKKENHIKSSACYDECIGPQGIRSCEDPGNIVGCYSDRSRSCYLDLREIKKLAEEYVDYVKQHPEENELLNRDTETSKDIVDSGVAPADSKVNQTSSKIGKEGDSEKDAANNEVQERRNDGSEVTVNRDCIEGPWGDWSECSRKCTTKNTTPIKRRKRAIYAVSLGDGSRKCETSETRPCEGIPNCADYCYGREGSGDAGKFQQKYYYIWSVMCKDIDVKKLELTYIPGSSPLAGAVSSSGDVGQIGSTQSQGARGRSLIMPPTVISALCNDPNNWTPCNAPCKQDSDEEPVEYLRAPITCNDTERPCSEKLDPCPEGMDDNESEVYGSCILKYARYDIKEHSWSRDGSCICEEGIACTAEELYINSDYSDIIALEYGSELEQKLRGTPFQSLISLANYKNIQLPWGVVTDATYGKFKEDEVNSFCASGIRDLSLYPERTLWTDCRLAVSSNNLDVTPDCKSRCMAIRKECEQIHPPKPIEKLSRCIIDKLDKELDNIYVIGFKVNECMPPNLGTALAEESEVCETTLPKDSKNKICLHMCEKILNLCKIAEKHQHEGNIRRCMVDHITTNDVMMEDRMLTDFSTLCTFKRVTVYGSGLVYCKTKQVACHPEEWSNWGECSNTCITMDPGSHAIPTRTRQRNLKKEDAALHEKCIEKGMVFVEHEKCLWLPQCQGDKVITEEITKFKQQVAWEAELNTTWNLQSWVLEDSNEKGGHTSEECSIYRGQRHVLNNKIIYQKSRCSCPPSMKPCSISESVHSYKWFDMLGIMCSQNEMRSVLFNQSSGFYRYSCYTKTFIREDFDAHQELCNEVDETTFVSCAGIAPYVHIYILCFLLILTGASAAFLIFIYTYYRSSNA